MESAGGCQNFDRILLFLFQNKVIKKKLIERLNQAIDVLNNPKKAQNSACIGTAL